MREGVVYREPQVSATPTAWPLLSFDIAKNRIAANYNVGGLQIQKYKCLSIEANFKLLQNVLKNKNDFISLYIKKM